MIRQLSYFLIALMAVGCSGNESTSGESVETPASVHEWAKNANMYEVNIRQYTPEGTFNAFSEHLPRLKEMGVSIIWLMPIHPIGEENRKGGMGSYYSVKDYKAVAADYGSKDDFQALVDKAHSLDMKVIIDWVANHSAWDNVWVDQGHTDWYTPDSNGNMQPPIGTDWWDVADLDYENKEMRLAMIDAMQYWVEEHDIDGFRCDVAQWVPDDFWVEARAALDSVKPVFMLAEAEHPPHHTTGAFHMSYGWDLHHRMNQIAKGEEEANHITDYITGNAERFPDDAYRLHFTSNHDENSWNGTVRERMGDGAEAFAVLSATLEGMPLIYSGQEAGLDKRLAFFEKDTIDWSDLSREEFYTKLLWLNTNNESLWNGEYGGDLQILTDDPKAYGYSRRNGDDAVVVLLNLSEESREISLAGAEFAGEYDELFSGTTAELAENHSEQLPAWGYRVYHITTK
jgi:glycosidase